jgi:hypothetical protein
LSLFSPPRSFSEIKDETSIPATFSLIICFQMDFCFP